MIWAFFFFFVFLSELRGKYSLVFGTITKKKVIFWSIHIKEHNCLGVMEYWSVEK